MKPLNTLSRPIIPAAPMTYNQADQAALRKAIADALERGSSSQSAYPLSQKGVVQCYLTLDSANNPIFLANDGTTVIANMAVFIAIQATRQSATTTQAVYRVTVTDFLPQSGSYLVITPTAEGCTVSPSTPSSPLASGGHVDYTVTLPSAGNGPGRVIFAASDTNGLRLTNFDVVDVPPAAEVTAAVSLTGVTPTKVDATHFTVTCTRSGFDAAVRFNITWTVDGISPGGTSNTHPDADFPVTITLSSGSMGATPSGLVTIDAIAGDGTVIATAKWNGLFTL